MSTCLKLVHKGHKGRHECCCEVFFVKYTFFIEFMHVCILCTWRVFQGFAAVRPLRTAPPQSQGKVPLEPRDATVEGRGREVIFSKISSEEKAKISVIRPVLSVRISD